MRKIAIVLNTETDSYNYLYETDSGEIVVETEESVFPLDTVSVSTDVLFEYVPQTDIYYKHFKGDIYMYLEEIQDIKGESYVLYCNPKKHIAFVRKQENFQIPVMHNGIEQKRFVRVDTTDF